MIYEAIGETAKAAQGDEAMTLLEILVRDWTDWPEYQRVYQDADGDLIGSNGYSFREVLGHAEIASDRATAVVTEHQWRSARGAKP